MFIFLLVLKARSEFEFPKLKHVSGGVFGWNKILKGLAGLFDNRNLGGYIIHSKLDFIKTTESIIDRMTTNDIRLTDYFKDIVNQMNLTTKVNKFRDIKNPTFEFGNISEIEPPNFTVSSEGVTMDHIIEALVGKTNESIDDVYIGVGMGVVFMSFALVIFFFVDLFAFLFFCCTCCCGKAVDSKRPTCCQTTLLIIGSICILVVSVFSFLCIPVVSDIKNVIVNIENIVPTFSVDLKENVERVKGTISDYVVDIPKELYAIPNDFRGPLDNFTIKINQILDASEGYLFGTTGFFSVLESGSDFSNLIDEINTDIQSLPPQYQQTVSVTDDINDVKNSLQTKFNDVDKMINDGLNMTKDLLPKITKHLDEIDINGTLDADGIFDDVNKLIEEMENYSLIDGAFGSNSSMNEFVRQIIDYVDKYWIILVILLVLIGLFFISLIICWTFTFFNKCCCCRCCCTRCFHCFPCCQLIFILVFGILSTSLMFVFSTVGADAFEMADTAVTKFADVFQPKRRIEIPQFSVELQRDAKNYFITFPNLKFQFEEKIEIFKKIFDAYEATGFETLFELSKFLDLDTLKTGMQGWNSNLSIAMRDIFCELAGQAVEDNSVFISNITGMQSVGDGYDIKQATEEPKQKLNDCINNDPINAAKCQNILDNVIKLEGMFDETQHSNGTFKGSIIQKLFETKTGLMETLVYSLNKTGFPVEIYDPIFKTLIDKKLTYVFDLAQDAVSLIPVVLDDIHVDLISGPMAVFYNTFLYNFGTFAAYASISLHVSLIGYLFAGLALKMRIAHLADPLHGSEDERSDLDDISSDLEDMGKGGKMKKKKKSRISSSSSSSSSGSIEIRPSKRKKPMKEDSQKQPVKPSSYSSYSSNSESSSMKQQFQSRKDSRRATGLNSSSFWLDYA